MPPTILESTIALDALRDAVDSPQLCQHELVSSGCTELDDCLRRKGLAQGSLLELLGAGAGAGAAFFAVNTARNALANGGVLVVVDMQDSFYPPAAARFGIAPERLLIVRPSTQREALWACEQALRSAGVAAVLCWPAHLTPLAFRRLQLAAKEGRTLGLLVRSARVQHEPSWADVRWLVSPAPSEAERRRFLVDVLRGQSRKDGALCLEATDEGALRMVPRLVDSAVTRSERHA